MEIAKKVNNFTLLTNATTTNKELEKVLDALPFYTMLVDEDNNVVYANKAVSHHFNAESRSLIGGYYPGIVQELGVPLVNSMQKKVKFQEKPAQSEIRYSDRGKWTSLSVYPTELRTQKGGKIFLQMIEDISPRKKPRKNSDMLSAGFTK